MFSPRSSTSASAYRQVSVQTSVDHATPHNLVEMLFDGLLVAVGSARAALRRGDIKSKCTQIIIAVRILEEGLKSALNLEQGGELAANLDRLYGYCVLRLTQANARNDDDALAEVARLIEPQARSWKQIGESADPKLRSA